MISPKHTTSALVTGAMGAIGSELIPYLLNRGYRVRALIRQLSPSDRFPVDIEVCHGDINDRDCLKKATEGIDVIFHLAAKLHINNPDPVFKTEYERINVEGTRRLVDAANSANVRRVVFFSTINVYGDSKYKAPLNESSALNPDSWYAETKAQAEKIVLKHHSGVVLRLATVYGPRMKGNFLVLLYVIRKGFFFIIGDGQNRRTIVYSDDVCKAAVLAAEHPKALGHIYNVTDGQVYTMQTIIAAMCEAVGKKPPKIKLPQALPRLILGIIEDGLKFLGIWPPFGRFTIDKLTGDLAVSGNKIQKDLGFNPETNLKNGWRTIA